MIASMFVAVIIVVGWIQHFRLKRFGTFINTQYANEISAIDVAAHRTEVMTNDFIFHELAGEHEHTFDSSTLYSVSMSFDGHHGTRSLKRMPEGYSWSLWHSAKVGDHSTICFGKSMSGDPLLIYTKWIPDARTWRHFRLVFLQNALVKEMTNKTVP